MHLPQTLQKAGIEVGSEPLPGDLGRLIYLHGVQNLQDYGFNYRHEAYCARIAADLILDENPGRSKFWLAKQRGQVIGSVLIVEREGNRAQLRLLFVDRAVRGIGLGRWLVSASIEYCRQNGFAELFLWTMLGLDRAIAIYESLSFRKVEEKEGVEWGRKVVEVQYCLQLQHRIRANRFLQ